MKNPSIFDYAAATIKSYRASIIRRRNARMVEGLPIYLQKDIGWPASQNDCCTDRAR